MEMREKPKSRQIQKHRNRGKMQEAKRVLALFLSLALAVGFLPVADSPLQVSAQQVEAEGTQALDQAGDENQPDTQNPGEDGVDNKNLEEDETDSKNPGEDETDSENPGEGETDTQNPGGETDSSNGEEVQNPQENTGEIQNPGENNGEAQNPGENAGEIQNPGENSGEAQNPGENTGEIQNPGENTGEIQNPGENAGEIQNPGENSGEVQNPGEDGDAKNPDQEKLDTRNRKLDEQNALIPAPQADGADEVLLDAQSDGSRAAVNLEGLSGSGTKEQPYQISSKENLEKFRDYVNGGGETEGKYFSLTGDITIGTWKNPSNSNDRFFSDQPEIWRPIGTKQNPFRGTFSGTDGKTLDLCFGYKDGVAVPGEAAQGQALFGYNAGTIQGVKVTGRIGQGKIESAAGIALENSGTISKCNVDIGLRAILKAGGIAAKNTGTIMECTVGSEKKAGESEETAKWKNWIGMHLEENVEAKTIRYFGGIAGDNEGTIQDCFNYQEITGDRYGTKQLQGYDNKYFYYTRGRIGGIAGYNAAGGLVDNCENYGDINVQWINTYSNYEVSGAGGIVGVQNSGGRLKDCFSSCRMKKEKRDDKNFAEALCRNGYVLGGLEDVYFSAWNGVGSGFDVRYEFMKGGFQTLKKAYDNITGCSYYWNKEGEGFDKDPYWGLAVGRKIGRAHV